MFRALDDNLFLSPVQYKNNDNEFEIQSPVYRWVGKYFDKNHNIETSGNKKIVPFTIGPVHYIATVNYKSNGDAFTLIDSLFVNISYFRWSIINLFGNTQVQFKFGKIRTISKNSNKVVYRH